MGNRLESFLGRNGTSPSHLELIGEFVTKKWTLVWLAREVAMSRSAFAARFTELVGEPAMHYVTRWRMHLVLTSLREDDAPLCEPQAIHPET